MATKVEKKNTIRKLIIESAKSYSEKLAGKTFLYVYGDEYFEILFKTDKFKHLTGFCLCRWELKTKQLRTVEAENL